MKIAALILAHAYPSELNSLLFRLKQPLWYPLIHIDSKSELVVSDISNCSNNLLTNKRKKIQWGGFSQVEATITLIREAYECKDCTHFALLSGQCYPIKPDKEIIKVLNTQANSGAFINSSSLLSPTSKIGLKRLKHYYFNDLFSNKKIAKLARGLTRLILPNKNVDKILRGIEPFYGSNWWVMDRESIGKILFFLDKNPWYIEAFRYSHCPDESFFQTLLNPCDIKILGPSLTNVVWTEAPNPLEINIERLNDAKSKNFIFARKFNYNKYPGVLKDSIFKEN